MRRRAVWVCGGAVLVALVLWAAMHLVPEFGNAVDRQVNAADYTSKDYVLKGEYQDTFRVLEQRQRAFPERLHRYFVYTKEGSRFLKQRRRNLLEICKACIAWTG